MSLAKELLSEQETIPVVVGKIKLELVYIPYKPEEKSLASLVSTVTELYQEAKWDVDRFESLHVIVLSRQSFPNGVERFRCEIKPESGQKSLFFAKKAMADIWFLSPSLLWILNFEKCMQNGLSVAIEVVKLTKNTFVLRQ